MIVDVVTIDVMPLDDDRLAPKSLQVCTDVGDLRRRPGTLDQSRRFAEDRGEITRERDDFDSLLRILAARFKVHPQAFRRKPRIPSPTTSASSSRLMTCFTAWRASSTT